MQYLTAITTDDACLDIQASGFWGVRSERAFIDVKIFNHLAKSYNDKPLSSVFSQLDQHKRRSYDQGLREVEFGNFPSLIFSAAGGT